MVQWRDTQESSSRSCSVDDGKDVGKECKILLRIQNLFHQLFVGKALPNYVNDWINIPLN